MGNTLKETLFLQEILSISTFYLSYQNKLLNYQSQRIPKADTTSTVSCCNTKVTNIRHATTNIMSWWRNMCTSSLKLVSTIFYQTFVFSSNDRPSKTMMKFLFHLKSFFRSWDIQTFVIFFLSFHTFQIQESKWKWNNLWCHRLACIKLQM